MTVLRKGSNGWICTPGNENKVGDPPMSVDELEMQWFRDALARKPAPKNRAPGLCYMLCGATQHSNDTPFGRTSPPIPVGPHWMVLWPFEAKHCGLPTTVRDAGAGSCSLGRLTPIFISAGRLGMVTSMHLEMKLDGPWHMPSAGSCPHDRTNVANPNLVQFSRSNVRCRLLLTDSDLNQRDSNLCFILLIKRNLALAGCPPRHPLMLIPQILMGTERESTPICTPQFSWMIPDEMALYGTTFDLHFECVVPAVLEYDRHAPGTGWERHPPIPFPRDHSQVLDSTLALGCKNS